MSAPAARRPDPRSARVPLAPERVDLRVRIGPLELRNPILTASGTFGYGDEYAHVVDLSTIGGVVTKTVTVEPRAGNAPQRVAETPAGMLNSIGLENVGLARFRSEKLPRLRELAATVIASVGGETAEELETLLQALGREPGVGAFEVNFSCPNVAAGGARYWADPERLERTLERLKPLTDKPLIAKLSPDVTDIRETARACERGGAAALTAVNTFVGMAIDLDHMKSRLGKATGGLSGPAIKPLALARCWEAAHAVQIPVLGSGGIASGRDALEFIAAGATAIQVGTATFVEPEAATRVLAEMRAWLGDHGYASVSELVGAFRAAPAQECAPETPTPEEARRP
jgi:dihydroorotate dehydrogenase (NAD+) catalytic subunit